MRVHYIIRTGNLCKLERTFEVCLQSVHFRLDAEIHTKSFCKPDSNGFRPLHLYKTSGGCKTSICPPERFREKRTRG